MKVTYHGPCDAIEIAETGQIIERGKSAEVPDELGIRLAEQSSFDAEAKAVLAFVGKDHDRAERMLRAELDGSQRADVVRPLEKLLKVEQPAELGETPAVGSSADDAANGTEG